MYKYLQVLAVCCFLLQACGEDKAVEQEQTEQDVPGKDTSSAQSLKKSDVPDGPYTEKYPGGQVKISGEIKNGTRFGNWTSFYPTGAKQSECYYEDGKKNGKSATFYKNGRVRYIGYYQWDKPSGTWEFYDSTGTLATKKEYK